MQAGQHGSAPTAGLKRLRCRSFPGAFEEQLLRLFSARSSFIRAQLECLGDEETSGRLQLPGGIGSLWLDCILTTPPELRKLEDETLAAYLKASEFLQDWDMVKELCNLLGSSLLKAGPEAACTSTSAQQHSTKQHIAQVLGELSSDLVIEVLRSAPGSLTEQLAQVPQSLTSLAALAHVPSIAAVFSSAAECTDQGSSTDLPVITLFVDSSQAQPVPDANISEDSEDDMPADMPAEDDMPAESEYGITEASIWPHKADLTEENMHNGLFTLEHRPGAVACRLVARTRTFQSMTISLPDSACMLLGSETGALNFQDVTFQGGAIVCSGGSCKATFESCEFDRCSLIVLSAAQATLSKPVFNNMLASRSGLSIFAHGVSSKVAVQGGIVKGGTQGVTVQAGAQLEATELSIAEVGVVGVEVKDEGSCLRLTGCNLHILSEMLNDLYGDPVVLGVHVHSSSSAQLSYLSVSGRHGVGICVTTHASATVVGCVVSGSSGDGVRIRGGGTGHLSRCALSGCIGGAGLHVVGAGSSADATDCTFLRNKRGAHAGEGGTLTEVSCTWW